MKQNKPFVAILMGSENDFETMQATTTILTNLQIPFEVNVLSAHRTPEQTKAYVQKCNSNGVGVFICAAGLAAHLAGFVAAHTLKPVIGVPLSAGSLQGMDALLATVQMPGGIPVACVAVGKPGAQNAAYLSAQILALQDPSITQRLAEQREENQQKILKANESLSQKYSLVPG